MEIDCRIQVLFSPHLSSALHQPGNSQSLLTRIISIIVFLWWKFWQISYTHNMDIKVSFISKRAKQRHQMPFVLQHNYTYYSIKCTKLFLLCYSLSINPCVTPLGIGSFTFIPHTHTTRILRRSLYKHEICVPTKIKTPVQLHHCISRIEKNKNK